MSQVNIPVTVFMFSPTTHPVSEHGDTKDDLHIDDLINFAGENNNTLLHVACSAGHTDIIQTLVSRGALLDALNNDSQTPLHLACAQNHEQIALCLVEQYEFIVFFTLLSIRLDYFLGPTSFFVSLHWF